MENREEQKDRLKASEIDNCISVLEHLLENGDQLTDLSS
jgi:hypothetical protein